MEKREVNIEEYYQKYGPMVLRRCRSILHDEDAALDAMQDVFVKLMTHKDKIRDDFPSSLLYRIATNTCLNLLRSNRVHVVSPDDSVLANIVHKEDDNEKIILNDYIDYVFRGEKISTRDMAYMHFVEKRTYDELSGITGMSVSGIRKRLQTFQNRIQYLREDCLGQKTI